MIGSILIKMLLASTTLIISNGISGMIDMKINVLILISYTSLIINKYKHPTIYITTKDIKQQKNDFKIFVFILICDVSFITIGTKIKLNINPNDGVNILDIPPVKLVNTGIPINPITIYIIIIISASIKGKISASSKTTSTCNVNDISDKGIDIYELTINSAKNILSIAIRLIVIFYPKILRSNPAATAEPITPATLGPIACINR